MDPRAAAQRFADTWQHGWARHDVETILTLYAEDAVHTSMPFRTPHTGTSQIADYLRRSFQTETDPQVTFSPPLVDGPHAAIEYRVTTPTTRLAGCVFVTFDADGLAVRTRDYWHEAPAG
ncbi:nuclear transport factor 2 family protein [Thermoactinospora rubra]|uniref:nuclear transport factor 2 family protein n=1 Tax=Thermoactinospora rubra TaxID=1088767 RepID=UPI000A11A6CD|nr:nuclear transport factor 2 family protein [Thermoactinospora rubra]